MKKKLALLLSAVMVVGMIPMTAFAKTTNSVDRIVTGKADAPYTAVADAPVLTIKEHDLDAISITAAGADKLVSFELSLTNAEWATQAVLDAAITASNSLTGFGDSSTISVSRMTDRLLAVDVTVKDVAAGSGLAAGAKSIKIPLLTTLKGEGDASVTIDPISSVLTSGTYKFGNVAAGATTTTIEKTSDIQSDGTEIKPIIIREAATGSMKSGTIRLKLSNGFEFGTVTDPISSISATVRPAGTVGAFAAVNGDDGVIEATFTKSGSAGPLTIVIDDLWVKYDEDDVNAGDIAEITISGTSDVTKQTIEVGTARTYGVTITAENKTLPTFIAGRYNTDDETLKVTFKETILDSWLDSRKTTITFPEGVKASVESAAIKAGGSGTLATTVSHKTDYTEITLGSMAGRSTAAKVEFKFNVSVDPGFTGDIVATFGGAGLGEDVDVVIGTVVAPVTVEAETNEVSIDYRNVAIGDIIIKETQAGNLESGKKLYLNVEDMRFDGTPKVEVVEGDIKIDKVKIATGTEGTLEISIKTASNKTPAVLKVTDNELFLNRTIPAGSYGLSLVMGSSDAIFQNYVADVKAAGAGDKIKFETDEVVVLDDFIEVVTAGRDQDDSTFTTKLSVTIGADKLVAGKTEIALDVPAYISEGYTMLPVRAVTEALSGKAIVRWDDATKTVTITFGSRVVSMTVGSKVMNINGVAVQMSKACEITDSRAFIPLRDLGYALGLNDSKINWDDATKTATLN